MEQGLTILTDFPEAERKLRDFLSAKEGFARREEVEPGLVAARVNALRPDEIDEVLEAGVHVELSVDGITESHVLLADSEEKMTDVLCGVNILNARVTDDGNNEVVSYIGPRLSKKDEARALEMGFRVGRYPLVVNSAG